MIDVAVIGGGPVGFVTALGLARAGLSVTLIEAEAGIGDSPRAAVYHWSVLDGLDALGLRADAERAGFAKQDYSYLVRATGERIDYDLSVLRGRTAFPYNIHLGQHRLAAIAHDALTRLPNATVRFGTRLTGLALDSDGVTLQLGQDGEELRARWVVGADGAGSMVRKALDLPFEGMTWAERFVATNVWFEFEAAGYALTTLVVDGDHGAVIAKLDAAGLWRCTYMENGALPEESFLDRLPAAYAALLPAAGGAWRLDRAAPYRMHQRSAPTYRVGRVTLAGDAAHVTNPTGGFGLTSGLFDAYALYPTLARILLDGADPALLDRWSAQRRAIFVDRVSPQASANKRLIFHANGGGAALEAGLDPIRRMARDADFRAERLMFVKSLETAPPV